MFIIGVNPLNILDDNKVEPLMVGADKFEAWIAEKQTAPKVATSQLVEMPTTPTAGKGAAAFGMLRSAFTQTNVAAIRSRIADLARRDLRDGDHTHLPQALRLAGGGKYQALDELIAAREIRQ